MRGDELNEETLCKKDPSNLHLSATETNYVKNGGKLIAEGGVAQREQNTMLQTIRPGANLVEVFGAQEIWRVVEDGQNYGVVMPDKTKLISKRMNASFELKGGTAIAYYEDGRIAMVENTYGQGKTVMTGFSLGLAYLLSLDDLWVSSLQNVLNDWCGLHSNKDDHPSLSYTRVLNTANGKIFFLFNMTSSEQCWACPENGYELISSTNIEKGECIMLGADDIRIIFLALRN